MGSERRGPGSLPRGPYRSFSRSPPPLHGAARPGRCREEVREPALGEHRAPVGTTHGAVVLDDFAYGPGVEAYLCASRSPPVGTSEVEIGIEHGGLLSGLPCPASAGRPSPSTFRALARRTLSSRSMKRMRVWRMRRGHRGHRERMLAGLIRGAVAVWVRHGTPQVRGKTGVLGAGAAVAAGRGRGDGGGSLPAGARDRRRPPACGCRCCSCRRGRWSRSHPAACRWRWGAAGSGAWAIAAAPGRRASGSAR